MHPCRASLPKLPRIRFEPSRDDGKPPKLIVRRAKGEKGMPAKLDAAQVALILKHRVQLQAWIDSGLTQPLDI